MKINLFLTKVLFLDKILPPAPRRTLLKHPTWGIQRKTAKTKKGNIQYGVIEETHNFKRF
jgi:hypothetical protein